MSVALIPQYDKSLTRSCHQGHGEQPTSDPFTPPAVRAIRRAAGVALQRGVRERPLRSRRRRRWARRSTCVRPVDRTRASSGRHHGQLSRARHAVRPLACPSRRPTATKDWLSS